MKHVYRKVVMPLVLVGLYSPGVMAAGTELTDYYFAGGGFYQFSDSERDAEDLNGGWKLSPGMRLKDNWWLEAQLTNTTLERGDGMGTDFYQWNVGANLQYAFGNRHELTPYVFVGLGASYNDVIPDDNDDWAGYATAGVGIVKQLWDFELLRWRAEASVIQDDYQDGYLDARIGIGLEFALQRERPAREPEVIVREVEVIREVVKEVPVTVVAPAPEPGNPDLDGDGVINEKDKCPDTPRGAKVDGDGCVVEQTLTLRDVTFEFNSSRLTMNGRRLLDSLVAFLRTEQTVSAVIEGHTDSKGTDAYNLKLSKARAESVRTHLVQQGIAPERLKAEGYGESRPIATNDTDEGREANRRVEFVIRKN